MEDRLVALEQRLARAERRSRVAGAMAVVGIAGAMVLAVARPAVTDGRGSTVKAPFQIIDAAGKTRLAVDVEGKGTTLLRIYNAQEKSWLG